MVMFRVAEGLKLDNSISIHGLAPGFFLHFQRTNIIVDGVDKHENCSRGSITTSCTF